MNCDQAFDALTDPNLRDSQELQTHLDNCPRCAEMQQILAPALDLFAPQSEAEHLDHATDSDSTRRPAEMFYLSPEAIQVAQQTADELARQQPAQGRSAQSAMLVMKYAALFLLGSAVTLGAFSLSSISKSADRSNNPGPVSQCVWKNRNVARPILEPADRSNIELTAANVTQTCVACHLPDAKLHPQDKPSAAQFSIPINPPRLLIQQL